jgi:hypothetical protein
MVLPPNPPDKGYRLYTSPFELIRRSRSPKSPSKACSDPDLSPPFEEGSLGFRFYPDLCIHGSPFIRGGLGWGKSLRSNRGAMLDRLPPVHFANEC